MAANSTFDAPVSGVDRGSRGSASQARTRPDKIARAIRRLRRSRAELENSLAEFPQLASAIRALRRVEQRLERPIRVAIVGEFNAGKSSLANLLVGIDILPTAVVPNTRFPTLLYYAAAPEVFAVMAAGKRIAISADVPPQDGSVVRLDAGLPSHRLHAAELLDLPGLADPRFESSPADLVPHDVDAVIWCTVATQAWKESERAAWFQLAPRLRRRGLLAVTHRDLLGNRQDEAEVMARLRRLVGAEFRDMVMVSNVSGLQADLETLEQSFERLLDAVRDERIRAAAQVASRIARQTLARIEPASALVAAE